MTTTPQVPRALTEEQRLHIQQAIDYMNDHAEDCRRGGTDSVADGCAATAWVLSNMLKPATLPEPAAAPAAQQPAHDDLSVDQLIELSDALQQQRALHIARTVRGLPPSGDMPTQFEAGFDLACEEILHRLEHEEWDLTTDGGWSPIGGHPAANAPRVPTAQVTAAARVAGEPVAWRYQDAWGHYRYRGYVPGFDAEHPLLKPIKLYAAATPSVPQTHPGETDTYIDSVVQGAAAHGRMRNPATQRSLDGAKLDLGRHLRQIASSSGTAPPVQVEDGVLQRAADMLTAYAELVKATGQYAEQHYIPELEYVVSELRAARGQSANG